MSSLDNQLAIHNKKLCVSPVFRLNQLICAVPRGRGFRFAAIFDVPADWRDEVEDLKLLDMGEPDTLS